MSVTGNKSDGSSSPFFRELKKHASFYLKERIKTARLAFTDVTPAQLLTEEATSASPWAPDTKTMGMISRAAFEVDDYWRIVDILHTRLLRFDETNWRISYKALSILEHLLTHGPESVAQEFQTDTDLAILGEMESFQYIDERGFNWGLTLRKKSQRVQTLLERGPLLKQERQRARALSRGIQGFGSFSNTSSSSSSAAVEETKQFGRSRSVFNHQDNNSSTSDSLILELEKSNERSPKENNVMVPLHPPDEDFDRIIIIKEEHPLLGDRGKYESKEVVPLTLEDHPFSDHLQHQSTASLLSTGHRDHL